MKSTVFRVLFSALFIAVSCHAQTIESLEDIQINGCQQKILIMGDISKPIILYLHGGPGFSSIPESNAYTNLLKKESLFVQWDQRGTGYSYSPSLDTSRMRMEQFVEDTKVLTDTLLKRFKKEKVYLVGHSWGSALGFYVTEKYPEKYYAFIGVGQVVNRVKHIAARIRWVRQKMDDAHDSTGLKELNRDINSNLRFIFKYGGFMHTVVNLDSVSKASPYYSTGYAEMLDRGAKFTQKYIPEKEQNLIDLTVFSSAKVPIYFLLGKYDWVAPTLFAVTFLNSLKAPEKEIVWFQNSGHLMMLEEPRKFQEELIKIVKKR